MKLEFNKIFQSIYSGIYSSFKNVPLHGHSGTEFVYIEKGTCVMKVLDKEMPCAAGDLVILPTLKPHSVKILSECRHLYTIFSMDKHIFSDSPRVLRLETDSRIPRWIEDLIFYQFSEKPPNEQVIHNLIYSIIIEIHTLENKHAKKQNFHPSIEKALEIIEESFCDQISITEIADHIGMSESHFRTLFRKQLGLNPNAYIQEKRINTAMKHLEDPYLTINEIAYRCGYTDPNYFIRIFTKKNGQPPNQWRKKVISKLAL